MVTAKQIKQAAETIDGLSAVVESQRVALKTANEKVAALEAEKAALGTAKTAAAVDATRLTGLAKKAAASLLQSGLISSPERAETFANEIMDPAKALIALEKFAAHSNVVRKVAASDLLVLLQGETGTGKGLFARAIHDLSHRAGRKYLAINCAAIPEALLESEWFGHVRGSFTGAYGDKKGLLAEAAGGTVFRVECADGTTWVVSGFAASATVPTFGDQ